MARTLVSWTEPTFFMLQFRTKGQWLARVAVASLIAAVFAGLLIMQWQNWVKATITGILVGAFLTMLPDFLLLWREIWFDEKEFHCDANAGTIHSFLKFPLSDVVKIELIRPETWGRKHAGIQLYLANGNTFLAGVPKSRKLETIATLLHRNGSVVELAGWEPTTADTRLMVDDELSLANLTPTTQDAVFEPMPAEEPKLNPTASVVTGAVLGGWPLLAWLIGAIWGGISLWQHWAAMTWLWRGVGIAAIVGGLIAAFMILIVATQYSEAAYRVGVARQSLRGRIKPMMDPDEDDVMPISLYNREKWAAVASTSADFGFLQVSRRKRAILFEGEKGRWSIPLTAMSALRVEKAEVGSEGNNPSEIRYFLVIGTTRDGQPWEIGLKSVRTTWGFDGADERRKRAAQLFDDLRSALSLV